MKRLLSVTVACATCVAFSETYYFVGASGSSWQDVNNYRLGSREGSVPQSLPGSSDIVDICGTPQQERQIEVPEADNDFIANLKGFAMWYGELTVTITTNTAFNCAFSGSPTPETAYNRVGRFIKKGEGTLSLNSRGKFNTSDYLIREIRVEAGEVDFLPNMTSGNADYIGTLTVFKGATVKLPSGGADGCSVDGFNGAGAIVYDGTRESYYTVTLAASAQQENVFSGTLTPPGKLKILLCGPQVFKGPAANYNYYCLEMNAYGYSTWGTVFGFENGGSSKTASPFGSQSLYVYNTAGKPVPTIKNVGDGSNDPKIFPQVWLSTAGDLVKLDGGEAGGLQATGGYFVHRGGNNASAKDGVSRIFLAGDGLKTNNWTVGIYSRSLSDGSDASTSPLALVKQGKGTWKIEEGITRQDSGVVAVNEGTLQYNTIAPVGSKCALGLGVLTYDPDYSFIGSDYDTSKAVGYQLRVGGGTTEGTLEYVGTTAVSNSDRIVAVNGFGRVKNSSGKSFEKWGFVTAKDGENTLALDGVNVAGDITNDTVRSTLSVVKEGDNTTELKGRQTFNGDLTVKGGKLVVSNVQPAYEYYRFTVKANMASEPVQMTGNAKNLVMIGEFGLYDAEGNNLTDGGKIVCKSSATVATLQPGEVCYGQGTEHSWWTGHDLDKLFDDTTTAWYGAAPKTTGMVVNDSTTWVSFVIRMPVGSPAVDSFDLVTPCHTTEANYYTAPRAFSLEASSDGVKWEPLFEETETVGKDKYHYARNVWISDGKAFAAGSVRKGIGNLAELPDLPQTETMLTNVRSVSVAEGATLSVEGDIAAFKGLTIDAQNGMGTIDGKLTLAETGVLNLTNVPEEKSFTVAIDWSRFANPAAVDKWTLTFDGMPTRKYVFTRTADGVRVDLRGLLILFW